MARYLVLDVMNHKDCYTFWSCPICMRKLEAISLKSAYCNDCKHSFPKNPEYRKYKLPLKVTQPDSCEISMMTVFGKSLENLFGCGADPFAQLISDAITPSQLVKYMNSILVGRMISVTVKKRDTLQQRAYPYFTAHSINIFKMADETTDCCENVTYRICCTNNLKFNTDWRTRIALSSNSNTDMLTASTSLEQGASKTVSNLPVPVNVSPPTPSNVGDGVSGCSAWHSSWIQEFDETFQELGHQTQDCKRRSSLRREMNQSVSHIVARRQLDTKYVNVSPSPISLAPFSALHRDDTSTPICSRTPALNKRTLSKDSGNSLTATHQPVKKICVKRDDDIVMNESSSFFPSLVNSGREANIDRPFDVSDDLFSDFTRMQDSSCDTTQ